MNSIQLILRNLHFSEEVTLSRIEDMADHALISPLKGASHTLWILGHLAYIESLVISCFMQDEGNPLEHWKQIFDGSEIESESSKYPPFESVLSECKRQRSATVENLLSLSEADLDQPSCNAPPESEQLFGTYRLCFQYVADHWLMHRGQLALARRAAGVREMWF